MKTFIIWLSKITCSPLVWTQSIKNLFPCNSFSRLFPEWSPDYFIHMLHFTITYTKFYLHFHHSHSKDISVILRDQPQLIILMHLTLAKKLPQSCSHPQIFYDFTLDDHKTTQVFIKDPHWTPLVTFLHCANCTLEYFTHLTMKELVLSFHNDCLS